MKRTLVILTVAALFALPLPARAQPGGGVVTRPAEQPPPPPPPVTLTPPVLKKDEGAVYPKQAIDDKVKDTVRVDVVIEVDPTGAPKSVTVETPQGHGFDEAAVEAANKLVFDPATRNGKPVAAKIRHSYVFAPPPSRVIGRITRQPSDTPVEGANVVLESEDGKRFETQTKADGTFEISNLPSGKYKLTAAAAGYGGLASEETFDPGQEAQINLRLTKEAPPPPPPLPGEELEEVQVKGTKPPREVTKRTLEQRELQRIPGTNGDALRAVQNMPGVARAPGLIGLLIVRGAAPQETNVYVDGTLVPIVYHFGGLSSVIPTEMLEKLDFYPGNFSSYYGRVSGGIIDVGVHDPKIKKDGSPHAIAQADLIDARLLLEAPLANSGWNFTLAGRRSYVDVWLKPALEQAGSSVTTAPVYYDYQAMVQRTWDHGKHDFRLFFFGADDRLEVLVRAVNAANPGIGGDITLGTAFYRLQARYIGKFSDTTELRVVAAVGKDAVDFSVGDNFFTLTSWPINPRAEISQKVAQGVRNNFGFDVFYAPYEVNVRLPPLPRPGEPPPGPFGSRPPLDVRDVDAIYRPAMYDELELTPVRGTRIVPGVRLDYAKETRQWDVQPRVVARQDLTKEFPRTTLKGGIGVFAQQPQPQETNKVFGMPGIKSTIVNHYGFGGEQEITKQIEVSLEGFYRQYDGIVVPRLGNVGEGRAFGAETLVRYKPDQRFLGFLAYTLSRSVRRDAPTDPERLFQFDQTHILTAVGSYRLGNGWEVGARFRLVSGNLRTPQTYGFYDATVGSYIPQTTYPPFGTRNPMFHQLDIRIDKTWLFKNGSTFSVYLDLYNAYNQGNVEGVSYNYNYTVSTQATGIPFLPSIGVRAEL
jgi:TonB family protein